jgi:hypothetical protein
MFPHRVCWADLSQTKNSYSRICLFEVPIIQVSEGPILGHVGSILSHLEVMLGKLLPMLHFERSWTSPKPNPSHAILAGKHGQPKPLLMFLLKACRPSHHFKGMLGLCWATALGESGPIAWPLRHWGHFNLRGCVGPVSLYVVPMLGHSQMHLPSHLQFPALYWQIWTNVWRRALHFSVGHRDNKKATAKPPVSFCGLVLEAFWKTHTRTNSESNPYTHSGKVFHIFVHSPWSEDRSPRSTVSGLEGFVFFHFDLTVNMHDLKPVLYKCLN